jgi:hypothetical protein
VHRAAIVENIEFCCRGPIPTACKGVEDMPREGVEGSKEWRMYLGRGWRELEV